MLFEIAEYRWIAFFFVYAFLGWIWETCYVSIRKKHFVNRGFLKGPMLPIYGFGAVMMLVVSEPFKDNLVLTFAAGVVGATTLELITGILMEKMFKVRYWDYSNQKFNYKGYICLSSSIAWGFFTIAMNKWIHPAVLKVLSLVPETVGEFLFAVVLITFFVDLVVSTREAMDLRNMLIYLEDARHEINRLKKRADVKLAFMEDDIKELREETKLNAEELAKTLLDFGAKHSLVAEMNHLQKRIQRNPRMVSRKYGNSLDVLKNMIGTYKYTDNKEDVDETISGE